MFPSRIRGAALASVAAVSLALLCACGSTSGGSATSAIASPSDTVAPSSSSTSATQAVIGMTVDEATAWANERGMSVRVVKRDGESLPGTTDYRPDRINVEVENGVITAADLG